MALTEETVKKALIADKGGIKFVIERQGVAFDEAAFEKFVTDVSADTRLHGETFKSENIGKTAASLVARNGGHFPTANQFVSEAASISGVAEPKIARPQQEPARVKRDRGVRQPKVTGGDNVDRSFVPAREAQLSQQEQRASTHASRVQRNERIIQETVRDGEQGTSFVQKIEQHPVSMGMALIIAGMTAFAAFESAQHIISKDERGENKINMGPLLWTLGSAAITAGTIYLARKPQEVEVLVH